MKERVAAFDREIEFASKDYYELPLEERFHIFVSLGRIAYDRNVGILDTFQIQRQYPLQGKLDEQRLTTELSDIVPSFRGTVQGRFFHPSVALHYIVDPASLAELFPQSAFGSLTGKVIVEGDNMLAPEYQDLAGLVIVQAKMESSEKDRHVTLHEVNHVIYSQHPNAKRRDAFARRLSEDMPTVERVNTLICLNEAILIDEAAASLHPYTGQGNPRTFRTDYVGDVRDATRNMIGFQLAGIRGSGGIDDFTVARITRHERDSMRFPIAVQQVVENLAARLRNPEKSEPYRYAMSYVEEALQVLDFDEVPTSLERFCIEVLEPYRLYGRSTGFLDVL